MNYIGINCTVKLGNQESKPSSDDAAYMVLTDNPQLIESLPRDFVIEYLKQAQREEP